MAGHLLIFMFMNVFLEAKGQDLAAPKLSVAPSLISETEYVKLKCQNPVPVSDCYYIFGTHPAKNLPCRKSLTGRELLSMVNQSSPAEVTVTCFYLKTSASPHSDTSIITVQRPKPEMSLHHGGDLIYITCELPESEDGSKCNLYFGESPQPYQTLSRLKSSSTNKLFCQFIVSVREFLTNLSTVQTKDISCDYTSESGHGALSPRSDGYNLKNLLNTLETNQPHVTTASFDSVKTTNTETRWTTGSETETTSSELMNTLETNQPHVTTASFDSVMTTNTETRRTTGSETTSSDLDNNTRPVTSSTGEAKTPLTPVQPRSKTTLKDSVVKKTSLQPKSGNSSSTNKPSTPSSLNSHRTLIWKLVILMSICGVTLGSVMLVMAFFCTKQTEGNSYVKRSQGNSTDDMDTQGPNSSGMPLAGEAYSLITSVPAAAGCSTGSVTVNRNVDVNESNPYHLYATISDEPTSVTMKNIVYSSLQMTDN